MDDPDDTLPISNPQLGSGGEASGFTDSAMQHLLGAASPTRSSPRAWQPPTLEQLQLALPQYEISGFIARGGMGAVYKGIQKTLRRTVAIKVLPPELEDGDMQFAARFKHEAQAMAQLNHPNIVAVYDAGETADGILYFVMELIEGTDLAKIIANQGRIEPQRALGIMHEVCEALAFAHDSGIIHRDIKPSNIMLDSRGRVKVADFGLAKTINVESTMLTGSNVAMGTPDFIAPEALISGTKLDQRADLYAVGVMLYQMITGKVPRGRFEPLSRSIPGIDKRIDRIIDRALQNDREARYSSAIELRSALTPILTTGMARRAAPAVESPFMTTKAPLIAVVMVTLGVFGFFMWDATRTNTDSATPPVQFGNSEPPSPPWQSVDFSAIDAPAFAITAKNSRMAGRVMHLTANDAWYGPASFRNGAVRATLIWTSSTKLPQLLLRQNASKPRYYLRATPDGGVELGIKRPEETVLASILGGTPRKAGDKVDLQLSCIGHRITMWINGKSMGSIENSTVDLVGTGGIQAQNGDFKSLEVLNLDSLPETDALKLLGAPAPGQTQAWQNLLPLVDLKKHAIRGEWSITNGELTCRPGEWALCEIPVDYQGGNYDIRYTVTRGDGEHLGMFFPFRKADTGGDIVIDYFNRFPDGLKRAGLENIGNSTFTDPGGIAITGVGWLPPGVLCTVLVQVREKELAVRIDDRPLFRWTADWSKLKQSKGREQELFADLHGRPVFGVGIYHCSAVYHSIEFREVPGSEGQSLPTEFK